MMHQNLLECLGCVVSVLIRHHTHNSVFVMNDLYQLVKNFLSWPHVPLGELDEWKCLVVDHNQVFPSKLDEIGMLLNVQLVWNCAD